MSLRTRLAIPIPKVTAGILTKVDDVCGSVINGEVTGAYRSVASRSWCRPTEQILGTKVSAFRRTAEIRAKTKKLIHLMLNRLSTVKIGGAGWPRELKRLTRIESYNPVIGPSGTHRAVGKHRGRCIQGDSPSACA